MHKTELDFPTIQFISHFKHRPGQNSEIWGSRSFSQRCAKVLELDVSSHGLRGKSQCQSHWSKRRTLPCGVQLMVHIDWVQFIPASACYMCAPPGCTGFFLLFSDLIRHRKSSWRLCPPGISCSHFFSRILLPL